MQRLRTFGAIALAAVLGLPAGWVRAEDQGDLIAQGIDLRRQNRDQEALPLFQKALELKATPRALGQLGTCEQALGLWVSAEMHIAKSLEHSGDPWVRVSEAALKRALSFVQDRLGSIEVWGKPAGAVVRIDGDEVATLPMTRAVRVPIGQRALVLEATGFIPESRTIEVRAGDSVREHFSLRPSTRAPTPIATSTVSSDASPKLPGSTVEADAIKVVPGDTPVQPGGDVASPPVYARWWFWAAVGVLVVAGGTSAFLLSHRSDDCGAPAGGLCTTF